LGLSTVSLQTVSLPLLRGTYELPDSDSFIFHRKLFNIRCGFICLKLNQMICLA
jgi:hypothetical protein